VRYFVLDECDKMLEKLGECRGVGDGLAHIPLHVAGRLGGGFSLCEGLSTTLVPSYHACICAGHCCVMYCTTVIV